MSDIKAGTMTHVIVYLAIFCVVVIKSKLNEEQK